MHHQPSIYRVADALPVLVVIATVIVATAISASPVHEVASRAIDRTSPDKAPAVLLALESLSHPLRLLLPWPGHRAEVDPPTYNEASYYATLHNESSPTLQERSSDEA